MKSFSAIILAAGKGTRMKSALPKPLHKLAHKPMLQYVIEACQEAGAKEIVVVIAADDKMTPALFPNIKTAIQAEQKGTGHATLIGFEALTQKVDKVVSMIGDMPFIEPEALKALVEVDNTVTVLGMQPEDPLRYGRLIVTNDGMLEKIVEYKDATEKQKKINLCNSGTICLEASKAKDLLTSIKTNNVAGEYYVTDVVGIARDRDERCGVSIAPYEQTAAANTREELAYLENVIQKKLRRKHMANGTTLIDPETVYFAHDTIIGQDVVIEPNVFFGPDVAIADNVMIRAFSHLEGCTVKSGAEIGPFARLRPDAQIGENVKIGNFVEIKKSIIGAGTKIPHLSYIGDTTIGSKTNVGAGSVTCNYDGFQKHRTTIGDNVFIGSNTVMVAPVTIEDGAMTAAGSVITTDAGPDSLVIARSKQIQKDNWAKEFRAKKKSSQE